ASSSFAALPLSLTSATHNLGVDRDYASFAVPLGASIKMDGCGAIYPALGAVFIAQFMGLELSTGQYFIIALASVLGSFGTAGVPGTAVIMATVVISAAGLPLEAIGILYAIDRILDMMRTMTNVTGQVLVPVLVARQTGLLDREVYERASSNVGVEAGGRGERQASWAAAVAPTRPRDAHQANAAAVKNISRLYTAAGTDIAALPSTLSAMKIARVPLWMPISIAIATACRRGRRSASGAA